MGLFYGVLVKNDGARVLPEKGVHRTVPDNPMNRTWINFIT